MKLAVMQPYFLPYLGYYQLLAAADKFVVYDDVNFITGGWINRNRILLHGQEHAIVIPVRAASQNRLINELELVSETNWREKLLETFRHAYRKAPEFALVFQLLGEVINCGETNLSSYLLNSLRQLMNYLQIETELVTTSAHYENKRLKAQDRILDICRQEQADVYLNLSGGKALYDETRFAEQGIALRFLEIPQLSYAQFREPFLPHLSIIDVLMFSPVETVKEFLHATVAVNAEAR